MSRGIRAEKITQEMRVTRFWMNVEMGHPDDCWDWTGYTEDGYGRFFDGERMRQAHELAVTWTTGEVRPRGFDSCHSCHNPACCKPSHLRFDTRQGNVDDATSAGRHARGERSGRSKLTESDVVTIRERHAAGATGRVLAADYGITEPGIQAVLVGRNWKQAGGPIRRIHGNTKHGRYTSQ